MYVLILPRGRSLLAPLLGKCDTVILVMLGLTDDQDIMTRQHAFIGQVDVFSVKLPSVIKARLFRSFTRFLPARRYASAGNSHSNVSVCPSVRHALVLCQNEES